MSTLAFGCALVLTLPAVAADRAKSTLAKAKATPGLQRSGSGAADKHKAGS